MKSYNIIDSHAHIFPQHIASKAVQAIGKFYQLPMSQSGSIQDLLQSGGAINVRRYVVHSTATTVAQVKSINDFIIDAVNTHASLIGYMTLHPDMDEFSIVEEIERCKKLGLVGIKLHPDFQKFFVNEPKAHKIYRNVCNLPILFHVGDSRYDYSHPLSFAKVAKEYPWLNCIAAHFGGYTKWDMIDYYKGLNNVYIDTSSSLFALSKNRAKEIISLIGEDKVFFASDYPMWTHKEELSRLLALDLTPAQKEKILSKNIATLLQLT